MAYIANPHPRLAAAAPNGQPKVDWLAWFNEGFVVTDGHLFANPANQELLTVRLLPEAYQQPIIQPRLQIVHSMASRGKASVEAAYTYALNENVKIEPHVFGPEMVTGRALQCMPLNRRADCSSAANMFRVPGEPASRAFGAISFELQDLGSATLNNTPITDRQMQTLVGLLTAVCATYSVWCTPIRKDVLPIQWQGISHHSNVKSWSGASHSCPGAARIAQMDVMRHEVATRLAHVYGAWGEQCPGDAEGA